jgi:hypothetical protein
LDFEEIPWHKLFTKTSTEVHECNSVCM